MGPDPMFRLTYGSGDFYDRGMGDGMLRQAPLAITIDFGFGYSQS